MVRFSKLYSTGLIGVALIAAPLQAANPPAASKLSVAQAAGNAEVMKLPICTGNDTKPCRKKVAGANGTVVWVLGTAVVAGAIVAASAGSP
ncbi:MAG: hypothetical protein O9254_00090 [Rhodobacteraceae bacterium]|nr:hypothetical protein [Paracoccaceae bacterium]